MACLSPTPKCWQKLLLDNCSAYGTQAVLLAELLVRLAALSDHEGLFAQVAVAVGNRIDAWVLRLALDKDSKFAWVGWDQAHAHGYDVDRVCWQYVETCKTLKGVDAYRSASFVTDKGDAGGLPLQFSATGFADNSAFINVPAVFVAIEEVGEGVPVPIRVVKQFLSTLVRGQD